MIIMRSADGFEIYKKVSQLIQIGIYCVDYGNKSNKFAFGGGEGVVYIC